MEVVYVTFGILSVFFLLLAMSNGLKRYIKGQFMRNVAKKHKFFGQLAALFALAHMVLALIDGASRLTGLLALLAILMTALFGSMFDQLKKKHFYVIHKMLALTTMFLVITHILFNHRI